MSSTGVNTVNVRIDLKQADTGTELLLAVAHEGSHVQDHLTHQRDFLAAANVSLAAAEAVNNGISRITHGASEMRAYGVTSVFAEFTLGGATGEESAVSGSFGNTTYKTELPPIRSTTVGGESIWKSSWQKIDVATVRARRIMAIGKGINNDPRYASKLNSPIQ